MAFMEWKESYSVGNPELDGDHKQLIDIINQIAQAEETHKPVQWVFQALDDYVSGHFHREEQRLEAANYPDLDQHKKAHKNFIEWLDTVRATYSMDPEAKFHLATTVNNYLKDWLANHILKTDMQYKSYMS